MEPDGDQNAVVNRRSAKTENRLECFVDTPKAPRGQMPAQLAGSAGIHGADLFNENPCSFAFDFAFGAE